MFVFVHQIRSEIQRVTDRMSCEHVKNLPVAVSFFISVALDVLFSASSLILLLSLDLLSAIQRLFLSRGVSSVAGLFRSASMRQIRVAVLATCPIQQEFDSSTPHVAAPLEIWSDLIALFACALNVPD